MGSGGGTNTVQSGPPAWMRPYIEDVTRQGQQQYNNFTPQYFPGSTVAPLSPQTQQAQQQMEGFGNSSFNQNVIGNAQTAQSTLANSGRNPAALAGTQQVGNSLPFYDYLRGNAVNQSLGGNTSQITSPVSPGIDPRVADSVGYGMALTPGLNTPTTDPTAIETASRNVSPVDAINQSLAAPGSNPYVDEMVQRTLAQNTQEFGQSVLPQIQNASQIQGGYGGSRQAIAEGLGMQALADANADAAAKLYYDSYSQDLARQLQGAGLATQLQATGAQTELARRGQDRNFALGEGQYNINRAGLGLDTGRLGIQGAGVDLASQGLGLQEQGQNRSYETALLGQALQGSGQGNQLLLGGINAGVSGSQSAMALAPGLQQMGLTGTQALAGSGTVQDQYNQALLNDEVNRFNFSQSVPYDALNQYSGIVQGTAGLSGSRQSTPTSSGGAAGALGGAATAAGVLGGMSAMGGQAAAIASGPYGWGLLALGALGGYFS